MTIALAALTVQAHGWRMRVACDYLPEVLLNAPGAPPPSSPERDRRPDGRDRAVPSGA